MDSFSALQHFVISQQLILANVVGDEPGLHHC